MMRIGCCCLVPVASGDGDEGYIVVEQEGRGIILPGGKHDPRLDGDMWTANAYRNTASREFREETGLLISEVYEALYLWHDDYVGSDGEHWKVYTFVRPRRMSCDDYEDATSRREQAAHHSRLGSRTELLASKFGNYYSRMFAVYDRTYGDRR